MYLRHALAQARASLAHDDQRLLRLYAAKLGAPHIAVLVFRVPHTGMFRVEARIDGVLQKPWPFTSLDEAREAARSEFEGLVEIHHHHESDLLVEE